jgi:hypothetical protein
MQGYDLVTFAKEALGRGLAMQKYGSIFFRNQARPSAVLLYPTKLSKPDRDELRANWERMQGGLDNAHRTAVLDGGLQVKELSLTARDSQLSDQERLSLVDVANIWGVPVHKVGGEGRTAYASLEQENQAYLDDGLDPWLVQFEEEAWDKLLTEDEKANDTHVVEFLRAALVRADLNARANYYRTALGGKPWMTQDEVRGAENLNLVGGGASDLSAPTPNPAQATPPASNEEDDGDDDQSEDEARTERNRLALLHRPLLADAVGRVTRRITHQAMRAAKKPSAFIPWLDQLNSANTQSADSITGAVAHAISKTWPPAGQPNAIASWVMSELTVAFNGLANRTPEKDLPEAVQQLATELDGTLPERAQALFLPLES